MLAEQAAPPPAIEAAGEGIAREAGEQFGLVAEENGGSALRCRFTGR
jgi:hypothetical protein